MRLIFYPTTGNRPKIVSAPANRHWMDATGEGFAYRCLPLSIANAHGWQILNPASFSAEWNGGAARADLVVTPSGPSEGLIAESHFGHGVLTFSVNGLFRTEPGWDLMVTGPFNCQKDAIQPLTGVVETDWSSATFTMNWRFTRSATIVFEVDEPFCMLFPVQRGVLEAIEPEIRPLLADPEVAAGYVAFADSRFAFLEELAQPGSAAQKEGWQKNYFQGRPEFGAAPANHRTKLRLKEFGDGDK